MPDSGAVRSGSAGTPAAQGESVGRPDLLTGLDRSRERILAAFAADPAALDRPYAPGKWTGRRMLFHIVDSESALADRLKRLLCEEKPLVLAFDENRWDARLTTPTRSLEVAKSLFAAQRAVLRELVPTLSPAELARAGVHSEAGLLTVGEVAAKIVWHGEHHLEQVEAAIAGRTWVKAG